MADNQLRDPDELSTLEIEDIERLCLRSLTQAVVDFGFEAYDIFDQSTDDVTEIAEDITREMLDRVGGYQIGQRVYGNVDYRRARYVILPDYMVRQALFVDSKAEKAQRTATLQMSQTSLTIHQTRGGGSVRQSGKLAVISEYQGVKYLTTTLLAHYYYTDEDQKRTLETVTLAAIPNGKLQQLYNPDIDDSIWLTGRNAPSRGELFRVRLGFDRLADKASWRVQRIHFLKSNRELIHDWNG